MQTWTSCLILLGDLTWRISWAAHQKQDLPSLIDGHYSHALSVSQPGTLRVQVWGLPAAT